MPDKEISSSAWLENGWEQMFKSGGKQVFSSIVVLPDKAGLVCFSAEMRRERAQLDLLKG